ncbi:aromatic amino acid ammonia-lyase [Polaribacter litorisediminis]|uniref:HAL/PAL/TAL family ammonia-lyase n=1 Tax=Polaribacter litorisediminis TaxID=1908341 RepID=UPI001CC16E41|nr:aromatic amino acid ammonia-lyase [Polaribacter litorisediminis]UAM98740.1 aromatic amino acid ammonia-lyase [Polaribacter litorisediminis]
MQHRDLDILVSKTWTNEDFIAVGRQRKKPVVTTSNIEKVAAAHKTLQELLQKGHWIYGVSSGFGPLANEDASKNTQRQERLIYHLATGVGPKLGIEITRMIFALRLKQLAQGYSGINPKSFQTLYDAFLKDFLPEIPALGSVGASGDLTPLAHLALGLSGKTNFYWKRKKYAASDFYKIKPISVVKWSDKDALAFVNGTAAMTAIASMNLYETNILFRLSCQLAFSYGECLGAYSEAWHPKLADLHPQVGHKELAKWLFHQSVEGWFQKGPKELDAGFNGKWPQDPYSIRCVPQLLGAVKDQLKQIEDCLQIEINSVSDNPNFFSDEKTVLHGGNFNGQHVSFSSDQLNLQIAYLGVYAEKRISTLCDSKLNLGLSPFLKSGSAGENSGFMGAQVTATALCAELKSLYKPLSLETLSTNGQNQDMVSMGTASAWRGQQMLTILKALISIETMVNTEALRHRKAQLESEPSKQSKDWLDYFSPNFSPLTQDRPLGSEIESLSERLIDIAEQFKLLPFRDLKSK